MKSLRESLLDNIDDALVKGDDTVKKELIIQFLKDNYYANKDFKISSKPDKNGLFTVSCMGGNVNVTNIHLTELTNGLFTFKNVSKFTCQHLPITTLKGAPEECSVFDCTGCSKLKNLIYSPKKVKSLICTLCYGLETLEGCSKQINAIDCSTCTRLMSLEGLPNRLSFLDISNCYSLEKENIKKLPKVIQNCRCEGSSYTIDDVKQNSKVTSFTQWIVLG